MDYSAILSKAWNILWKHKALWIFGILAGCGNAAASGGNGVNGSQANQYNFDFQDGNLPDWLNRIFGSIDSSNWQILAGGFILLGLVLAVILAVLWLIGTIGLIKGTQMADAGAEKLTFREVWNASTPFFWRMLGLSLLLWLIGAVLVMLLIAFTVGFSIITLGLGVLCLLPLLCLLVPVGMLLGIVVQQAYVAVVVDDLSVMEGLRRGWEVVRQNFWNYVVLGLIVLVGITWVGGFLAGLPVFLGVLPLFAGFMAAGERAVNTGLLISAILLLFALPLSIFLNGLLQTFSQSVWTLAYLRNRPGSLSSIPAVEPVEPLPPAN